MSEEPRFEPEALLQRLDAEGVRFVVIGGIAAQAHGSPSITRDLGIVPSWDPTNLRALAVALADVAAVRHGLPDDVPRLPPLDERTLLAGGVFTLRTRHGRLDLLANPDPGLDYEALARSALRMELDGIPVAIAGLEEVLGALREEIDRSG